jgi:hypothetical protein
MVVQAFYLFICLKKSGSLHVRSSRPYAPPHDQLYELTIRFQLGENDDSRFTAESWNREDPTLVSSVPCHLNSVSQYQGDYQGPQLWGRLVQHNGFMGGPVL